MREKIEKLAEELYNWAGRYGAHGGVLWKDARGSKQQEYITEAEFILQEFIEKLFGYRSPTLLKEEIEKVENPYPQLLQSKLENIAWVIWEDCRQVILKILT